MKDFAAIDFETANFRRESVCSVGLVLVEEGKVVGSYYHLIQPTPNYFEERCVTVHGLTTADTNGQPTFPDVWAEIAPLIRNKPRRKLKEAGLADFRLPTVASHCGYELDMHHHALADAEACAAIALKIL